MIWKRRKRGSGNAGVVTLAEGKSSAAEAYHTLRTNILFSGLDDPVHSILVTSPKPESGKTTTLVNLGIAIARTGSSVLLVDGDLRRPALHKVFGKNNLEGLTTLLIDDGLRPEDVIRETEIEYLHVLTSGPVPPNPSELLVSRAFQRTLEKLKERYRYLLLDSPPVLAVTDPSLLSQHVDGTLLVVDFGQVPREMAQKARQQLEAVKARVLGVVLNKIPTNGLHDYYYYYPGYYGEEEQPKSGRKKKYKRKQR